MNNLQVIIKNGKFLVESREVAELIEREHKHLMRDIRGYIEVLNKSHSPRLDSEKFL
ncbi:Rha family transcriptional regulator [Clostridioides difficile]